MAARFSPSCVILLNLLASDCDAPATRNRYATAPLPSKASIATANPGMPVKNSEYAVWQSVQEQKQIFEAMLNPTTAMKVMAFYAEPHPIMYSLTFDYNTYNTTCSCLQGSMFFLPEIEQWNVNASVTEISAKENLDGHDCAVFEQKGYVIPGADDFKAYFELEKGALPSGDLVPRMFTYSFQPDPKNHPEAYVVENKTYTHIEYGTPSADEFKIPVACKNIPSCRIGVEGVTSAKQELKRMLGADW